MKNVVLIMSLFGVIGCATTSGVMKMGPDTYQMSSHYSVIRGGAEAAQEDVIGSANEYCAQMNKEVLVKNTEKIYSQTAGAYTGFSAIFQCLSKGDAALVRPNYEPTPSVVIKNQAGN